MYLVLWRVRLKVSQHFAKVPSFGACKFKSCTLLFSTD